MGFCFVSHSSQFLYAQKTRQDMLVCSVSPQVHWHMDLLSGIYYTYLYIIIEIIQTLPVIISHIIKRTTELLLHGKLYRGSSECPWDTTTISAETKYLILHLIVFPFLPPPATTTSFCCCASSESTCLCQQSLEVQSQ